MSRSFRWLLAAVVALGASNAMAQAASCNITYTWPTWVGGNGFGASIDIHNTGAAITNGWTLVFNDDFNQASLDTNTWYTRFIYNNGTMDHFNDELERYRENGNHVLQDGILNLVAKEPNANGLYPSGMIRSRKTFRYGYFESRIKLPPGRGLFPA